ncbi:MAG TPA: response regulator transcription factor, partial [Nitriliruptorales bacterium]
MSTATPMRTSADVWPDVSTDAWPDDWIDPWADASTDVSTDVWGGGGSVTRITVIDDHPYVRQGLVGLLGDEPDFDVVGQYETAERALEQVARDRPDVAVLDIHLPGMSGIEACRELTERWPECRSVVLTSFDEDATLISAMVAGARGFVVKSTEPWVLRQAIRYVLAGGIYVDPKVAGLLVSYALAGHRT